MTRSLERFDYGFCQQSQSLGHLPQLLSRHRGIADQGEAEHGVGPPAPFLPVKALLGGGCQWAGLSSCSHHHCEGGTITSRRSFAKSYFFRRPPPPPSSGISVRYSNSLNPGLTRHSTVLSQGAPWGTSHSGHVCWTPPGRTPPWLGRKDACGVRRSGALKGNLGPLRNGGGRWGPTREPGVGAGQSTPWKSHRTQRAADWPEGGECWL